MKNMEVNMSSKFPVRHSQLSPLALMGELKKRYNMNNLVSCRFYREGVNDTYIVKTSIENYFLRISPTGVYSRHDYEEELSIINTLCENGIRLALPVRCRDGSLIWEIDAPEGIRYATLFTEAKQAPSKDETKMTYNLGSMVAQMHTIADEKKFVVSRAPIQLQQLAIRPLKLIQPYLSHRPEDYDFLYGAAEKLQSYVKSHFSYEKPYYGFCHGDIQSGNVFFEGEMPTIFDFDCMGYGWRAYDICVFVWNHTLNDGKYIESDDWKAFLDGYNSVRQLSDIEKASINDFAALRTLWVMGLQADLLERLADCCWYNDGYFDSRIRRFKLWYERSVSKET
jgi:Ser/Thr protein kinase RdoA (MazF antagonist)